MKHLEVASSAHATELGPLGVLSLAFTSLRGVSLVGTRYHAESVDLLLKLRRLGWTRVEALANPSEAFLQSLNSFPLSILRAGPLSSVTTCCVSAPPSASDSGSSTLLKAFNSTARLGESMNQAKGQKSLWVQGGKWTACEKGFGIAV